MIKIPFLENLTKSVENRNQLYQTFISRYPSNIFLATKLEQEYIIALSEQCNYIEPSVLKAIHKNLVLTKSKECEKKIIYTSSLTDYIKGNIQNF